MSLHFFSVRKACLGSTCLAVAFTAALVCAPGLANAEDSQIQLLQGQIDNLQKQITAMKAQPVAAPMSMPSVLAPDGTLTWYGITLYGTLDVGVSGQTHGSNYNADFVTGVGEMLQKNGGGTKWGVTPAGMEQNKIGIKGSEEVYEDISAVFKLETGFNPVSGVLSSSQKAQIDNIGNSVLANTSTNGDSSRAGQPFEGAAFAGLSSPTYGTLTFGRHTTPLADNVTAYDPQGSSYAFSPIEWSGQIAGAGDTENARLDDSIKYNVKYGPARFMGIYQFANNTNPAGGDEGYQADIGFDYARLSMDALYSKKRDAINTSVSTVANTLNATVSDNEAFAVFAKYDLAPVKLLGGYEHITYRNPKTALSNYAESLSGYAFNTLTQNAYNVNERFHAMWIGAQYAMTPKLTLSIAYYRYMQDNYSGMGSNAACMAAGNKRCDGSENFGSLSADYKLTKRFDAYAGFMYTRVVDGMYVGNGYLHSNNFSPATGLRFKF